MKGMRLGLSVCLGCRVCVRGMSAARYKRTLGVV